MNPPMIFAPSPRIAQRYAHRNRLSPQTRTIMDVDNVLRRTGLNVIVLVGDHHGTFDVTPRGRRISETLLEREALGDLHLFYRWLEEPPFPTLNEVAQSIHAAIPEIKDITFKPPAPRNNISVTELGEIVSRVFGSAFGTVIFNYGEGRSFIFPLSEAAWNAEPGRLSFEVLDGIIDASRYHLNRWRR